MKVRWAFTCDLKPFSAHPDEEEELMVPGLCFTVQRMQFDSHSNKHLIHLQLTQRHTRMFPMISARCLSLAQHFREIDNARMKPPVDNTTTTARAALRTIDSLYSRATGSPAGLLSRVDDRDPAHVLGAKRYAVDTISARSRSSW